MLQPPGRGEEWLVPPTEGAGEEARPAALAPPLYPPLPPPSEASSLLTPPNGERYELQEKKAFDLLQSVVHLERQLTYPAHVLQLLARLALEAFLALPGSSAPSFRTIVQGATESYSNFIDRLWDAVIYHPELNDESKQQMFQVLAFDNANRTTKQALALWQLDVTHIPEFGRLKSQSSLGA